MSLRPSNIDLLTEAASKLIGAEVGLEDTARALNTGVRRVRAGMVGALQVVCSDESERECSEVFQRRFVHSFLPSLKFSNPFPFRTVNLGGRYEWGSARLAENHFSGGSDGTSPKLIVVKINSHVSVLRGFDGPVFGQMPRYGQDSFFCGALNGLLETGQAGAGELFEAFQSEGRNRVEILLDVERVAPSLRSLYAAIVNARLQARQAVVDIQDFRPSSPTMYLVIPCVTLNRREPDTELVCGLYSVDWRGESADAVYEGLGDDPGAYRAQLTHQGIQVEDAESRTPREARDHRKLALEALKEHALLPIEDQRVAQIEARVAERGNDLAPYAGVLLKSLVALMLEFSPIPAVLLLFGEGLIDVRHIYQAQKIARSRGGEGEARGLLREVHDRLDSIPPERAGRLLERLLAHHRPDTRAQGPHESSAAV